MKSATRPAFGSVTTWTGDVIGSGPSTVATGNAIGAIIMIGVVAIRIPDIPAMLPMLIVTKHGGRVAVTIVLPEIIRGPKPPLPGRPGTCRQIEHRTPDGVTRILRPLLETVLNVRGLVAAIHRRIAGLKIHPRP